jgi:pimeloyl-ACP methyl ester carboxylesterase
VAISPLQTRRATIAVCASVVILLAVGLCAPAGASARKLLGPCPDTRDVQCGTVKVALDRANPAMGTIPIFFRFVRHTASGPVGDPIFTTEGGPGYSVNENDWQGYVELAFRKLRAHHDLVFIDQRGTGRSRAIDCPSVQNGITGDLLAPVAQCAAHLGAAANDYGSGDVALDIDAVRAALGIDKFEFYGGSYAAVDVQTYAARFASHLDAVVLDSPVKIVDIDDLARSTPPAIVRTVRLICKRSASCSADQPAPGALLSWLAGRLRRHPVLGVRIDSNGKRHRLRVTEGTLAWRLMSSSGFPLGVYTEITAAAAALKSGDDTPLLRLAANTTGPLFGPFAGDRSSAPTAFSGGDNFARFCTDATFPWSKDASLSVRGQQFESARAGLAATTFAPFSVGAWLAGSPVGPLGPDPCIVWPAPAPTVPPAVPPGATFPSIPALVLSGDLDTTVPSADARDVAKLFPDSHFIELAGSGHHTLFSFRSGCSQALVQRFLASRAVGNTSCARRPGITFPAVGRFPRLARGVQPALVSSRASDHSTPRGRRVAAAAAWTLRDVLDNAESSDPNGVGLRGGSYAGEFGDSALTLKLTRVRFTQDVTVSGHVTLQYKGGLAAKLNVHGPGGQSGQLRISGVYLARGAKRLRITGLLGARQVSLAIPAT